MFNRILRIFQQLKTKQTGAALILSLLILLALTLLGLSILLQSHTEYSISLNERDATIALYDAEAVIQLVKLKMSATSDFSELLRGPDNDATTLGDNGIMQIRTISAGVTRSQLNHICTAGSTTCESDRSVIETFDGNAYEVFRIGMNKDNSAVPGESNWDGPRGVLYVRITDNHDEEPFPDDPYTDLDRRVNVEIVSDYPVFVNASGIETKANSVTNRVIGTSRRTLLARFGPTNIKPAIATRHDMELGDTFSVCGECGAVHANGTMTIEPSSVSVCSDVTATEAFPTVDPTATVGGTVATAPEIPIPIGNPYHEDYIPLHTQFDTSTDTEFASYPDLQTCDAWNSSTNPGGTKFFALYADGGQGRVFKAYWNDVSGVWYWRLIDILEDGHSTQLDDCGRVVSFDGASSPVGNFSNGTVSTAPDVGIGTAIPDNNTPVDREFYGFRFDSSTGTVTCDASADETLSGIGENDYGSPSVISTTSYMLPGTGGPAPVDPGNKDGVADFDAGHCYGKNDAIWSINGTVYSPLYNAVIFIYGNLSISGRPNELCSSSDTACDQVIPNGIWRVTFLTLGSIDASGNPSYAPFRHWSVAPDQQAVMIAGRDMDITGTSGAGNQICPTTVCSDPPLVLAGYEGLVVAHEQIRFVGTTTINGLVYSEDAATCGDLVDGPGISGSGTVDIYYDCEHPPGISGEGVAMTSWEENQQ